MTANDIRRVGYIHFPHLLQITLLRENIEINTTSASMTNLNITSEVMPSGVPTASSISLTQMSSPRTSATLIHCNSATQKDQWGNPLPILTAKSKIFELNNINEVAKVK